MKLTKRILVVAVMLAILVSVFAFASSAEFTEDNIDDILEYYYPKYVKENFNVENAAGYCPPLHASVSTDLKTDIAEIAVDSDNESNKYLSYYYVAENMDPGYFGYDFSVSGGVAETIFSTKVYVERGLAVSLPTYSINIFAYDKYDSPVGESSLVTPLTLNFETGEVYYAKANSTNPSIYAATLVDDIEFAIKEDTWYTVTLFVDGATGYYRFIIESEFDDIYESSELSLGNAAYINELIASYTTLPTTSGVICAIDDVEFYRGTFVRGDEDLDEITVSTLVGIAELIESGNLDFETKLKIIEVYDAILNSDYTPDFSNKYYESDVVALYESAKKYAPIVYTEFFCEEVLTIDSGKSYARRQDKLVELATFFPLMNGESFYTANIDNALANLENKVYIDFELAIAEHNLKYQDAVTEDDIAALDEELAAIKAAKGEAEDAFKAYRLAFLRKEDADTRVSTLEDTISSLVSDFEDSSEYLTEAIEIITENEELLAVLREALDIYNAEIAALHEVKKDSENFISFMKTFDPDSRDYTYLRDAYDQVAQYELRDSSYNYSYDNPECVYYYIPTFEALEKKVAEMNAVIDQFRSGVLIMQEEDADFNRLFNVGYLTAKEVYNDGKIYEGVDVATVPSLTLDIAKYLEIEASFSVTIEASENFIASVNTAMFNTLYETKKVALAAAKALLESDKNINMAYPGVSEAAAKIATVEKDIKALEDAAADYLAAVADIGTKTSFNEKKAAIDKALSLQAAGNVVGIAGISEANGALLNYSAEIQILEGNSKTFLDSVKALDNPELTLAERRALIIVAEGVRVGAEPTYDGVEAALASLASHKEAYKVSVEAINSAFSSEIAKVTVVAGASVNQSRYYPVIELIKLMIVSFK